MMIIIFAVSFACCFILYMIAANVDDNFFDDDTSSSSSQGETEPDTGTTGSGQDATAGSGNGAGQQTANNIIYPVPQSEAVESSYIENCCLVTDGTLPGIEEKAKFGDVVGSPDLGAASVNTKAVSGDFGEVTVYEALKLKKPANIYIMLGSDIGVSAVDDMVSGYKAFVSDLSASLPEAKIYVMQIPPVYSESGNVTNSLIDEYNSKLLKMAKECGVYCLDTNTDFKNNSGGLREEYLAEDNISLNDGFYEDICSFILTHTA